MRFNAQYVMSSDAFQALATPKEIEQRVKYNLAHDLALKVLQTYGGGIDLKRLDDYSQLQYLLSVHVFTDRELEAYVDTRVYYRLQELRKESL